MKVSFVWTLLLVCYLQSIRALRDWVDIGAPIDGEAEGDQSGLAVSISFDGNRVAVGAPRNDGNGDSSGQVRVYEMIFSSWVQIGLDIDGKFAGDNAGNSVSLSADGGRLAVGSYLSDGNSQVNSGQTRVFEFGSSGWVQIGNDINGEAAGDNAGFSVSLSASGNRLAVGAWENDGGGRVDSGHVRVFDFDSSSSVWLQLGADIDGADARVYSGTSVSLSADGSRVAIGAFLNDISGETDAGMTRVYEYSSTFLIWEQVGADFHGEARGDKSGRAVALSSDGFRLAIGAYLNDGAAGGSSGHVRVYEYGTSSWAQLGADIDGEAGGDFSGYSVSLSNDGSRVAIGAYLNDGGGESAGQVRVYDYDISSLLWVQVGSDIDGKEINGFSGYSVALSGDGNRLIIGAYLVSSSTGQAIVRQFIDVPTGEPTGQPTGQPTFGLREWILVGNPIDGEANFDYSGRAVSLSEFGNWVAIGALSNDANGYNSGQVRVYENVGSEWVQRGSDIDGEAAYDYSGSAVSLSADGGRIAIGAYGNDGNGDFSGHVRVYEYQVASAAGYN